MQHEGAGVNLRDINWYNDEDAKVIRAGQTWGNIAAYKAKVECLNWCIESMNLSKAARILDVAAALLNSRSSSKKRIMIHFIRSSSVMRSLIDMRYKPCNKDILVLSWIVLVCVLIGAVIGFFLDERTPFRHVGGACFFFILGLYAYHRRSR